MPYQVKREDGKYLIGQDALSVTDHPVAPFETRADAHSAVHRYRLEAAFCAPARQYDGFLIIQDGYSPAPPSPEPRPMRLVIGQLFRAPRLA